jgi:chemotaxis signal transduction protein
MWFSIGMIPCEDLDDKSPMNQPTTIDGPATISAEPSAILGEEFAQSDDAVTRYVVVEINHNLYGMSTESTVELMSADMTQITRVPQSPDFITGVINHRGTIIPVIDMRSLLGFEPRSAEAEKLTATFNQLKKDHVEWLDALQDAVYKDLEFTKATDPTKCNFGKWYESIIDGSSPMSAMAQGDPILKALIERFDAPHRKIHSIAEQVLRLNQEGKQEEAVKIISAVRDTDLALMCELFDQILVAIVSKLDSMMVITEVGSRKTAIAVDGVSFVADCKDESIEPLPDTAENTEFLSGLVHQSDGSYILITDLKHIYNIASPA